MGVLKAVGTALLVWLLTWVFHRFLFGGDDDTWN